MPLEFRPVLPTSPTNSSASIPEETVREAALRTLKMEADAIAALSGRIGPDFDRTVTTVLAQGQLGGRLVFTGIGKSADVARKTVATLNSTGTPSAFLHAADALHGDLGLVSPADVVVAVSKSGATAELVQLMPLLQSRGVVLVAMVGRMDSPVARAAQCVLDVSVEQEACPHNLAPTTSSATQLAMGDALAMALMAARGFGPEDFARFHPGGSLGRRLLLRLGDLMDEHQQAYIGPTAPLQDVLPALSAGRVGAVAVLEGGRPEGRLLGIITDGDLRRALDGPAESWSSLTADQLLNADPQQLTPDASAATALDLLESRRMSQIVVCAEDGQFLGFVHLHQLMDAGLR